MSQHTLGPWAKDQDAFLMEPGFYGVPRDGHDSYHSITIPGVTEMTGFCGEANARLIAAAPELLDALRLVELDCVREDIPTDAGRVAYILKNVRAALAKVQP